MPMCSTPSNDSRCSHCGGPLTGRQLKYCKPDCAKLAVRERWISEVYGLTLVTYELILEHQGYRCAVCKKPFKPGKTPHIDHEHGGHVRGIVCVFCNTRLIGRLKSAQLAQWLADYLHSPPAIEALGVKTMAPGRPPKKRRPRKKVSNG